VPSVIIPAHNEERIVADCLRSILADGIPDLEVIVVPNGCSDRTAEVARSFGPQVTVVELQEGGKTNAINRGEAAARSFPRAFIDGDIVLERGALAATFAALKDGIEIASPPPVTDFGDGSILVRWFYRALDFNAYFESGAPNGSGVFAVTAAGRARWGPFPNILADDGFVQCQFEPHERVTSRGPGAIVRAPRTFASLVKVQVRTRLGMLQLAELHPDIVGRRTDAGKGGMLKRMLPKPWLWPPLFTFVGTRLYARFAAARAWRKRELKWSHDRSARS